MKPARPAWDHLIGLALAAGYVTWLVITSRTLGFARDEGFYFQAASDYARWFDLLWHQGAKALERSTIDRYWADNHEHPSLLKSLFGISWLLLHEKWKLIDQASLTFRLPGMLLAGLAVWITHVFGARAYGRWAGVMAAVLFALMPRVFYHSHLAAFDIGIVTMWTLSIFVYWKASQRGGVLWPILTGLVYGLTLDTKHNAWILPAVMLAHAAFTLVSRSLRGIRTARFAIPGALLAMASLGPLLMFALWPWIWHDTVDRLRWYASFHLHHEYYNMEFLGRNYFLNPSPRAYLPVMVLATVPSITLLLFGVGLGERVQQAWKGLLTWLRERKMDKPASGPSADESALLPAQPTADTDVLVVLALAAAVSPWLLSTNTPIFGGTKHWMPAYPFLCLLAGRGFQLVMGRLKDAFPKLSFGRAVPATAGLAAVCVAAPLAETIHSHPFGLTSYVPLVGGTEGAADLGLNRQFWGFTTQSANAWLSKNAPRGATVFIHDTSWQSWAQMIVENRVRSDLRGVGTPGEAQFSLVHHELHMNEVDFTIWIAYGTDAPVFVVTHDGVPVVSIYRRP